MTLAGKACVRGLFVGLALTFLALPGRSEDAKAGATTAEQVQRDKQAEDRLRRDVTFLASDECEGRGPTTQGLNKAADYIVAEFKKAGLKPGVKGEYFQPFKIPGADGKVALVGPADKRIDLQYRSQFLPLGYDMTGKASGGVVFVGYGLTSKAPAYDDYAGIDVKGKVVVLLRDKPKSKQVVGSKEMLIQAGLVNKLETAKKKGAVAVIVVNDAETATPNDIPVDFSDMPVRSFFGRGRILAVSARREVADTMMPAGKSIAEIEKGIDRDLKPNSFDMPGWTVSVELSRDNQKIPLKNVIGVLEGNGPLAKETVVVGAHYDHLGYGGPYSMSPSKIRQIHHGADDNASGTTAMMELARRFAAIPNRQGRRLVFMAFSGEELGLLGSLYYCNHPIFDLKDTAAMYNLDMVGRVSQDPKTGMGKLLSEGHGTAKPFKEMIDTLAKKYQFSFVSQQASGIGPSDHASFCAKGVPVLFIWNGDHPDYHKPTDTADRINVPGMRRVVDLSEEAITTLTKMEKPAFVQVKGIFPVRVTGGPRLGVRPTYSSDKAGPGGGRRHAWRSRRQGRDQARRPHHQHRRQDDQGHRQLYAGDEHAEEGSRL